MPDLNELLRWSIANSTPPTSGAQGDGTTGAEQPPLSLRFNPASETPSPGSSALHPSDPQYGTSSYGGQNAEDHPAHSTNTPAANPALNSEILEAIMGKSDSTVMKEKMAFALDESNDVDQRVEALDDFEMLIEHLDNANNMAVLKLWEPILSLLSSPHETIVAHACWIIGTAVQNNIKAQSALYAHNALSQILTVISPSSSHSPATRSRATYALSSALKHWPLASSALSASSSRGYQTLKEGIRDPEPVVRKKMQFLIGTLVMQSGEQYSGELPKEVAEILKEQGQTTDGNARESLVEGLKREGIFVTVLEALKSQKGGDVEFEENAMRALVNATEKGGLDTSEKEQVKQIWESWGKDGREERGLGGNEGDDMAKILA
ncbi:nucleotide exchange factor Fes1-domain-containing protein [Kockovaella imperatae]|uniref:Nucleotide exchange factor Fes1-domain-containing protein n=1 Tax=Kockovaella imperatae TaxID=4999 RepID=A0A1Y1URH5_9TREE|nr:nucleotide exchange factor Fes1-domain-containing protein [Kockovaella imperatae]ORX40046.1 nucleotide exchange factor Fes1-domain-containing protein [Kockovaella imperatae]